MAYTIPTPSIPLPVLLTRAITARPVAQLLEMARELNTRFDDCSCDVLMGILADLENKMPEAKFVSFCAELEAV